MFAVVENQRKHRWQACELRILLFKAVIELDNVLTS